MRINRLILSLAIPSIVANITTPLLGIVDVAIVGHLGSAFYLAAIALGGTMFNMMYWLFGFLRMGTSGMTAQAFGAADRRSEAHALYRSLVVALSAGVMLIALQEPLGSFVLRFLDSDEVTLPLVRLYFSICVWGAPAVLGGFALGGWLVGMQDSRATMWVSIIVNVCNIAVSLVLVYVFDMGIGGVATGTLVAQWVGFVAGLAMVWRLHRPVWPEWHAIFISGELKRFFSVNTDIFLRTLCLVAVTVWFTKSGARQSAVMLAVNALLMQLFTLFSYFMDGFAFAGEALCGRFTGSGDRQAFRRSVASLMMWGAGVASVFTLLYLAGGERFVGLMSDDSEVVTVAGEYFGWAVAVPLAGFLAFTWDGVFVGVTRTRLMLMSMVCAAAVYFAVYSIFFRALGNHALWLAFILYLAVRGVFQTVAYYVYIRK